jgi:hypothetical protein
MEVVFHTQQRRQRKAILANKPEEASEKTIAVGSF